MPRQPALTARNADKHELYQIAVQDPLVDLGFMTRVYSRRFGHAPRLFREDFCGTALLSASWVKGSGERRAEGFDLNADVLRWGREHNLAPLGARAERVSLRRADVRSPGSFRPEIRSATNFSYYVFRTRAELVQYFTAARKSLARDGLFVIDAYGGSEATAELSERRSIGRGVTYVWDQALYLPGSGEYHCHIHFRFRDGSRLQRAFTYIWRYWSIPELLDALHDAGFGRVEAYFEQSAKDGSGNGVFRLDPEGRTSRDCAGLIAYLVASGD
jgi:hypothetical protein